MIMMSGLFDSEQSHPTGRHRHPVEQQGEDEGEAQGHVIHEGIVIACRAVKPNLSPSLNICGFSPPSTGAT
jgi:hypothetical protein